MIGPRAFLRSTNRSVWRYFTRNFTGTSSASSQGQYFFSAYHQTRKPAQCQSYTMTHNTSLLRFNEAMKTVYGPFDKLTDDQAEEWVPPDRPGAGGHRGRYLWTDAFGVVNFISLYGETSSSKYLALARRLVQTVHDVLGKTRDGSDRLPGATDDEPLKGGLRIGKMDETGSDGDGQYHHYLTLWMFALNRLSLATKDSSYNDLAIQLAQAIHPKFVSSGDQGKLRMVWKVSMDMQNVLVPSEGHLDAATGSVIYRLLDQTALVQGGKQGILKQETDDYKILMSRKGSLSPSGDTLDLGMGLWMCHFFKGEAWATGFGTEALQLAQKLLKEDSSLMRTDASQRLAFREFGTCLGILCYGGDEGLNERVAALVEFWGLHQLEEKDDLRPISQVMHAAAMFPGGKSKFPKFLQGLHANGDSFPPRISLLRMNLPLEIVFRTVFCTCKQAIKQQSMDYLATLVHAYVWPYMPTVLRSCPLLGKLLLVCSWTPARPSISVYTINGSLY